MNDGEGAIAVSLWEEYVDLPLDQMSRMMFRNLEVGESNRGIQLESTASLEVEVSIVMKFGAVY